ncbi:MAG: hypothetical protein AAB638_00260 [Patescibacteria group bacterium]
MNEFTSKKLGEVLAFAIVGKEIFEKGKEALVQVFESDGVVKIIEEIEKHIATLTGLATTLNISEIAIPKSEKTSAKLREMLELYVSDQWHNPIELLEWLGFFEGAAIVHWKLVEGASKAINDAALIELSRIGLEFHQNLLDDVSTKIQAVGATKSTT